jgi:uncharacterized protein YbjT (DUF2867 family)
MNLVVGSTGSLGTSVVKKLAAAGKPVTALVRDLSSPKAKALQGAGAKLVTGDLKDPASLEKALKGATTVICTASATMSRQEGDSVETVDQQGIQSLIAAAEKANIKRFIFVSFSRNILSDFPLSMGKRAAEKKLESSTMDYTLLLPSYFAETWFSPAVGFDVAGGTVKIYGEGNKKVNYIALEDVAKAVVACVDNASTSKQAIQMGGPAALSQLDAVAIAEKVSGKKFQRESMTGDQIKDARGASSTR